MSGIGDGGRAFPSGAIDPLFGGMTLWDWFAGQALYGMLASEPLAHDMTPEMWAHNAYVFADAMIAERAKGGE